jgi:WD40 repeat protein
MRFSDLFLCRSQIVSVMILIASTVSSAQTPREFRPETPIRTLTFSADGQHLLIATADYKVQIYETQTGQLLRTLAGHNQPITAIGALPGKPDCITADSTGELRHWDYETGGLLRKMAYSSQEVVQQIQISTDATQMATLTADGVVSVWNISLGQVAYRLTGDAAQTTVDFRGGQRLATTADARQIIWLWDLDYYRAEKMPRASRSAVRMLWLLPDQKTIIALHADHQIRQYNADTRQGANGFDAGQPVTCFAFDATGERLITGAANGRVQVWNWVSRTLLHEFKNRESVLYVAFHPTENSVLAGFNAPVARLWSLTPTEQAESVK